MEKSLESSGTVPRIVQVMYFKGQMSQPSDPAVPQQQCEAQWEEFLKTLQRPHTGWVNPPLMDQVPWDDARSFLSAFEQVAEACRWPREEWVGRLLPALRGGVEQFFCRLDARERADYLKVKAAILRADSIQTEAKRQDFRQCCYQEIEGPRRAYSQLKDLCRQWLKPEKHTKEEIVELIIREQLLATMPSDVKTWIQECGAEDCIELVALAEDFMMGHRSARSWDGQVQGVSSVDGEVVQPGPAERQLCSGIGQRSNRDIHLMASEAIQSRNPALVFPPEGQGVPGTGQMEGPEDVKTILGGDQKHLHLEFLKDHSGTSGAFSARILSQIKTENCQVDNSETDDTFGELLQESPGASSSNLEADRNPSPERQLGRPTRRQRKCIKRNGRYYPPEKKHTCSECGHKTYYLSDMLRHMAKHTKKTYKCPICGKGYKGSDSFAAHQKTHLRMGDPQERCTRSATSEARNATKEARNVTSEPIRNGHICSTCGRSLPTQDSLAEHMKIHLEDKSYECPVCGQHFRWKSNLSRHQRLHTSVSDHRITRKGTNQPSMIRDNSSRLQNATSPDAVLLSPKNYESSPVLRLRPRKPQGQVVSPQLGTKTLQVVLTKFGSLHEGPYRCPQCNHKSERLSDLVKHLRVHTGERPYECKNCGKTFRWPSKLREHQRFRCKTKTGVPNEAVKKSHPNVKGYKKSGKGKNSQQEKCRLKNQNGTPRKTALECERPGRSPRYRTALQKNPAKYLKRKHSCSYCGYRAEKLSDLINHSRIHTGEKPYECPDCGKSFTWASNCRKHRMTHLSYSRMPVEKPSFVANTPTDHQEMAVAECDVTLSDDEELINILAKPSQRGGNRIEHQPMTSPEDSLGDISLTPEGRAKSKVPRRQRSPGTSAVLQRDGPGGNKTKYEPQQRKHQCSDCGHWAFYLSDLIRHRRTHTGEKPYKCHDCGRTFAQTSALNSHQRRLKSCCGPQSEKNLVQTNPKHQGRGRKPGRPQKYTCSKCGHKTYKLATLLIHMKSHTGDRPHKCQECGQTFKWSSNLSRHKKIHMTDSGHGKRRSFPKPLKMNGGSEKARKITKSTSLVVKVKEEEEFLPLSPSSPRPSPVESPREHSVTHTAAETKSNKEQEKKPAEDSQEPDGLAAVRAKLEKFAYSKGGDMGPSQPELVAGQANESMDVKPFKCSECEKCFTEEDSFLAHQSSHTVAGLYKCSECGECFSWKYKLLQHQMTHTEVKVLPCPQCGKAFYEREALAAHLKLHSYHKLS